MYRESRNRSLKEGRKEDWILLLNLSIAHWFLLGSIQLHFDFQRAIYNLVTVPYGLAENTSRTGVRAGGHKDRSEVKRKSAKRTFTTERELLEFTLSYKKFLSGRDAAISRKDKLNSLCRELQRQHKMLMDECRRVSTESRNLRLNLSNKFQEAIKNVTSKLEEQMDDSLTQLKENELRNQLKQKEDQVALTEQQYTQHLLQENLVCSLENQRRVLIITCIAGMIIVISYEKRPIYQYRFETQAEFLKTVLKALLDLARKGKDNVLTGRG